MGTGCVARLLISQMPYGQAGPCGCWEVSSLFLYPSCEELRWRMIHDVRRIARSAWGGSQPCSGSRCHSRHCFPPACPVICSRASSSPLFTGACLARGFLALHAVNGDENDKPLGGTVPPQVAVTSQDTKIVSERGEAGLRAFFDRSLPVQQPGPDTLLNIIARSNASSY